MDMTPIEVLLIILLCFYYLVALYLCMTKVKLVINKERTDVQSGASGTKLHNMENHIIDVSRI